MIFNNVSDFMMASFLICHFELLKIIPFHSKACVNWGILNRKPESKNSKNSKRKKKNNDENLTRRLPFYNMEQAWIPEFHFNEIKQCWIKCKEIIQWVADRGKTFLDKRQILKKTWLSKLCCHVNTNVNIHVATTFQF